MPKPSKQEIDSYIDSVSSSPDVASWLKAVAQHESSYNTEAKAGNKPGSSRGLLQIRPKFAADYFIDNVDDWQSQVRGVAKWASKKGFDLASPEGRSAAYLVYNQGPAGARAILRAAAGEGELPESVLRAIGNQAAGKGLSGTSQEIAQAFTARQSAKFARSQKAAQGAARTSGVPDFVARASQSQAPPPGAPQSSHLMQWGGGPDPRISYAPGADIPQYEAMPTVFPTGRGELMQMEPGLAAAYARQTGEYRQFKNAKDAAAYAENGLIDHSPGSLANIAAMRMSGATYEDEKRYLEFANKRRSEIDEIVKQAALGKSSELANSMPKPYETIGPENMVPQSQMLKEIDDIQRENLAALDRFGPYSNPDQKMAVYIPGSGLGGAMTAPASGVTQVAIRKKAVDALAPTLPAAKAAKPGGISGGVAESTGAKVDWGQGRDYFNREWAAKNAKLPEPPSSGAKIDWGPGKEYFDKRFAKVKE